MPVNLTKNWNIFVQCLRIQWVTLGEYKDNFFFDFFSRGCGFIMFWLTWSAVLGQTTIPGWDLHGLLLFAGMQEIFLSLILMFAYGVIGIKDAILRGTLDTYLSRPCNEWFTISMQNGFMAFAGMVIGLAILAVAWFDGIYTLSVIKFLLVTASAIVGLGIAYLFGLIAVTATLWVGKNDIYDRIFWSIFEFDYYPTNIFPSAIQIFISFTIPFMLVQTVPSLLLLDRIPLMTAFWWLAISMVILIANYLVFSLLWKRGLKRYEAWGG